jgi:Heparan-alpha-glucosaminide N-acetyltransferase, catalytic
MRYASIDVLRTVAIFLMVIVHFLENLSGRDWVPAGLGAPMFGFLVGVSYRISLNSRTARGRTEQQITARSFRRGLFIFGLGIVFNIVVWLPADTFNWDVLTLLGSAMLVLMLIRDQPSLVPLLICGLVFGLSPVLRLHSGYHEYWSPGYYDPDWTFAQLSLGYLVNGYFPIFPWLIFPLLGYVVGTHVLPDSRASAANAGLTWRRVRGTALAGIAVIVLAAMLRFNRAEASGSVASRIFSGWTMFPASLEYVTGVLGMVLLTFALALWWIDGRRGLDRLPWLLAFARTMGQYSLSVYVLHHVLHLWPLWVYGLCYGTETTEFWRKALPWEVALLWVIPCMVLMYLLFRWVERGQRASLETLMRRICD